MVSLQRRKWREDWVNMMEYSKPDSGLNYNLEYLIEPQVRLREQARQTAHSFQFIYNLCKDFPLHNQINPEDYRRWSIKRGLRNDDGTGVQAGITLIGNVDGYRLEDGEKLPAEGRLYYRGVEISELIEGFVAEGRSGFEEVSYLLLFGQLPTKGQLEDFKEILSDFLTLPNRFTEDAILSAPSPNVMNKLARSMLAMYSYDPDPENGSLNSEIYKALQLVARCPVIVAQAYAAKRHYCDCESLLIQPPQPGLSVAENLLYCLRPDHKFLPEEARLLDVCLVLHAEHGGGNNSTFACRVLSSTGTDIYSAISAAVGALKGPKHGGANCKVQEMFWHIQEEVSDWEDDGTVQDYLVRLLRKEAGDHAGLIYGMGHAVYTLSDPRAVILKRYARALAGPAGLEREFHLIERVERLAPPLIQEWCRTDKPICANVDLYSGFVYHMMGIPEELFTPLFAVARMPGWCAHRIEEVHNPLNRIIRPAYREVAPRRQYVPLEER